MIRFQAQAAAPPSPPCQARKSVVEKLADEIREMGFSGEAMTAEAFSQHGFPLPVVERYGAQACALARRRAIRQIA
jgi:hypothetical protein